MNMMLLDSYSFGNRKAVVFQLQETQFRVELYEDNKLVTYIVSPSLSEATKVAQSFTDGNNSQLLRENV